MRKSDWVLAVGIIVIFALMAVFVAAITLEIRGVSRAIACELALSPEKRNDQAVIFCFTSNGQNPPELP